MVVLIFQVKLYAKRYFSQTFHRIYLNCAFSRKTAFFIESSVDLIQTCKPTRCLSGRGVHVAPPVIFKKNMLFLLI